MVRPYRCLLLFLLATGCLWGDNRAGRENLIFPLPDRPVAPIVSSAYSNEEVRDAKGEAARVMDRLAIIPSVRVADIGAGEGYYTVRLARRLGPSATIYAQDVNEDHLSRLEARLEKEGIRGISLIPGRANDPRVMPGSVDVALLAHVYHEIINPYEFFYRLRPALAADGRVAVIDVDRLTRDHGTPPALLRCELEALGYRQIDFVSLEPADGYLAIFLPPRELPPIAAIRPCATDKIGE